MECIGIDNQIDKPKELETKQPTQPDLVESKSTSMANSGAKTTNKIVWYMGDDILKFDFRQN